MTITTTWLTGSDCMEQYGISDDMVCTGRISGLDITDNGSSVNISPWSAYVKVVDASWFEMNVKVYSDTVQTLTKVAWNEIIIKVPLANVQNAQNNTDFSSIATFEVVPTGTGWDFHLVLARFGAWGTVGATTNAWHYLPWCDFCMRCVWGDLQLPDVDVTWTLVVEWASRFDSSVTLNGNLDLNGSANIQDDLVVWGTLFWDASGLTNVPPSVIPYMTETTNGLWQIATQGEIISFNWDRVLTTGNIEYLLQMFPDWNVLACSDGWSTNSWTFTTLAEFFIRIQWTYRVAFLAWWDTWGGSAQYQVLVNWVPTSWLNVWWTTLNIWNIINYNSGSFKDQWTVSKYFWNNPDNFWGGQQYDLYYWEFNVSSAITPTRISIQWRDIWDTAVVSRAEIMWRPLFYPTVTV